ncbi:MAG: cytochrome c [Gammaproteobacteria bacterium]|nr:cytochrome c [Gammaproteobacteria bacterium]
MRCALLFPSTLFSGQPGRAHEPGTQPAQPPRGALLFASCTGCHGGDAGGSRDGTIPALAGQHYRYLIKQLLDFADSERPMTPGAQHPAIDLKADEREQLSSFLASLAPIERPRTGDGKAMARGRELYRAACKACHLETALGSADLGVPSLRGQHYPYLLRQIRDIARAHRFNTPADLILLTEGMSPQEIAAVADYLSRLGCPDLILVRDQRAPAEST